MTREERQARRDACAAVDAMWAARPLRPPPGRIPDRVVAASRLALIQDRKAGVVDSVAIPERRRALPRALMNSAAARSSWFDSEDRE